MSLLMVRPGDSHRDLHGHSAQDDSSAVQGGTRETEAPRQGAACVDPAITELQRAKAAAEAANEAKSRYLVAVSHEIRSPLNAIYGYAQLLERGDAVTGAEAGAAIRRSVDHLTNLAESLLEISRIESGVLKIRSGVIDIRAVLGQVISMFRAQAIAKGLGLTLTVGTNLPALVKTDEKRLKQVLINLVSNAIKYTDSGSIDVVVAYRNEVATIDVIDTGIGMEPSDIERMFEAFERGSSNNVQSQPGIGLGLTITRVLAQVLGGDVTARSIPGEGSRFRLKLMLSPAIPVVDNAARSLIAGYEGPRRTVLIVEDDPEQRAATQSLLQSLGFIVHIAKTGEEGLELVVRCAPDVVLLDVEMPGIDGWETARRLRRAHDTGLKIVMVSANAVDTDRGGGHDRTYDAFVAKPIAFEALFATMQQQLGLEWNYAAPVQASDDGPAAFPVTAETSVFLDRLRRSAQIGHVLGFEKQLAELERAIPATVPFVASLRECMENFDFSSIIEKIENAGSG